VLNLKFAPENGIMILWNCKSSQAVMWFCVQQTFFYALIVLYISQVFKLG